MNSYAWKCPACGTPNVLVVDEKKEGHTTLSCKACGEPGRFEKGVLTMSPSYPQISVSYSEVCVSTHSSYGVTTPSIIHRDGGY